jgi:hypothetical protein
VKGKIEPATTDLIKEENLTFTLLIDVDPFIL